jgi:hypothetical protein
MTFSDNSAEAVRLTGALTVPEPTTLTLMAFSAGVLLRRRRQQV